MANFQYDQQTFARGVLSPALRGKPASNLYKQGLYGGLNMLVSKEGSLSRRPSSRFIASTSGASKLFSFVSSTGVEWVIEIRTDKTARFYTQQSMLVKDGTPHSTTGLPYSAEEVRTVSIATRANQVYLLHPNHTPRLLTLGGSYPFWTLSTPSFSGLMAGKKPAHGTFYGQRSVFGGFRDSPGQFLFSRTPDENGNLRLTDFTKGTDADHAMDFKTAKAEAVYWMIERNNGLVFGTFSGIYELGTRTADQALSGTNAEVRRLNQLPVGILPPEEVNQAFFIAHNSLREVSQATFSYEQAGFITQNITFTAKNFFEDKISAMTYSEDEGILWFLVNGKLYSYSFSPESEVMAFMEHEIGGGGIVHAISVINGAVGDQLWLCIERDAVFTIEVIQFKQVLAMPHHLDAVVYAEDGRMTLAGLDHLNDKTVKLVTEKTEEERTISGGQVTLNQAAQHIAVGHAMVSRVDFLSPPQVFSDNRNSNGLSILSALEIDFENSSGFDVLAYDDQGKSQSVSGTTGVHFGGVGTSTYQLSGVFHSNLPTHYTTRPRIGVQSTSARPLSIHRYSIRGGVE